MPNTYAVIGLGLFGIKVCEVLMEKGAEVIAIDSSIQRINKVKDYVTQAILLDSTDADALSDAPIDQIDAAFVAIGDNVEASILTSALLIEMSIPYIISRAMNRTHYQVLKKLGVHEVLNVEEDQARRAALNLISPSFMEKVVLSKNIILSETKIPVPLVKYSIGEIDIEEKYQVRLVALRRMDSHLDADGNIQRKEELIFPRKEDVFKDDDVLILVGDESKIDAFISMKEEK
jgi:trk system potassium uptake protein TrkA